MTTYALANNITRFHQILGYENTITGGMFGLVILIVIFVISFIAMRQSNTSFQSTNAHIFSASMFITTFFAVMFYLMNLVNDLAMYACVILLAFAIIGNVYSGN